MCENKVHILLGDQPIRIKVVPEHEYVLYLLHAYMSKISLNFVSRGE
jgi:hypothetical protein